MKIKPQFKRIYLKSGASLSIQASQYHYCSPRTDNGPYSSVEIGFIEKADAPESFRPYADGEFPSSVYGYLPIELLEEFILDQGGIDLARTL